MAKYRKVDPRIWNDQKFRALGDEGKLVFFFLLTHPHMTSIGAMRASLAGLASEMGWFEESFREAFREVLAKGMAEHDERACLVVLPRFLKYNGAESPNVVKSWANALDVLPECALLYETIQRVKAYAEGLPKAFTEALPEAFSKAMPYQEQEQEQEQEQLKPLAPSDPGKPDRSPPKPKVTWSELDGFAIPEAIRLAWGNAFPAVGLDAEIAKAHAWAIANPKNRKSDWGRYLNSWLARAQDHAPRVSEQKPADWRKDPRFAGAI